METGAEDSMGKRGIDFRINTEASPAQLLGAGRSAAWRGQESLGKRSSMGTAGSHSYLGSDSPVSVTCRVTSNALSPQTPCTVFAALTPVPLSDLTPAFFSPLPSVSCPLYKFVWGQTQVFLGGKKYFQRKINFRGARKMKTFSQRPRTNRRRKK